MTAFETLFAGLIIFASVAILVDSFRSP